MFVVPLWGNGLGQGIHRQECLCYNSGGDGHRQECPWYNGGRAGLG